MGEKNTSQEILYRPGLFVLGAYAVTWLCVVLLATMDVASYGFLGIAANFLGSASPLIVAVVLLWKFRCKEGFWNRFIFGERRGWLVYTVVAALFVVQFLNFYLFRIGDAMLSVGVFLPAFAGQLLLGGGLEEGGWRGYLLPALQRRCSVLAASLCVSLIWVVWHLPYFLLPGTIHSGGDFLSYTVIGIITGFILAAIYMLTKSVLLCTLFHSWQNTIVMTIQADMQNAGFLVMFLSLGVVSAAICLCVQKKERAGN